MNLGPLTDAAGQATAEALALVPRIWNRDHTVWDEDPTEISDRLGWLDAPERADVDALTALASEIRSEGFTDALLVGMGGSSLYPAVLAELFGPAAGGVRLHVLDSTDPAAVLAAEAALPWERTLLIPASKSGGTVETISHLERFWARLVEARGDAAGEAVLAITDPGSSLEQRAAREGYRPPVVGQPDVGGRFSALTPFGLLPAALLGLDLRVQLSAAASQLAGARVVEPTTNGAAMLGAVMAAGVRTGRDKLTIALPDELASFGAWIEQLIAESTGKRGTGVVPVIDEPLASLLERGDLGDRVVVSLGDHDEVARLEQRGVPVLALPWSGPEQLGAEVVRWEFATAVAGALLGLNPFDQPDVQAAKDATARVLEEGTGLPATVDPGEVLDHVGPGTLLGLLAFVTPGGEDERRVREAAATLGRRTGAAVTVGIGPRYLHSTGQLHKGGPANAAFLLVVGDDQQEVEIPGRAYGFSRLKRAQAAGDLQALAAAGRRVAHVRLEDLPGA